MICRFWVITLFAYWKTETVYTSSITKKKSTEYLTVGEAESKSNQIMTNS